ncbi:MAG TPA: hypothetical protein PLW93_05930, partial [Candidatus Absconditabacterales bacterium]|nr:hypothetical protein [Candidatus Absconditabacterales bacterium]
MYSLGLDKLVEEGYILAYRYQIPFEIYTPVLVAGTGKLAGLNYTADFAIVGAKKAEGVFARTQFTTGASVSTDSSRLHYADAELALSVDVVESNINAQQTDILGVSYVDVKGKFIGVNNNSALTFPIIQKLMYHDIINSGVYINKIKPLAARGLFNYTFTPDSYIYRKDGSKRRTV